MVAMVRLIATLIFFFAALPACAHDSWISRNRLTDPASGQWCCNQIDCTAIPANGLREVTGGYSVAATGEIIPYGRVIWRSEDGEWWRCRNLQNNSTRCLIGPPPGF
jgi:hypothetical protein